MFHKTRQITTLAIRALLGGFSGVHAENLDQLDNYLQVKTDGTSIQKNLSDFSAKALKGNLYNAALSTVRVNDAVTYRQAQIGIQNFMNTQYSCNLTTKDTLALLLEGDFSSEVSRVVGMDDPTHDQIDTSFQAACSKLLACSDPGFAGKIQFASQKTQCLDRMQNIFTILKSQSDYRSTFDQKNYGNDQFYNGRSDDSPYDLSVDMANIADIMFLTDRQPPQLYIWQMPTVTTPIAFDSASASRMPNAGAITPPAGGTQRTAPWSTSGSDTSTGSDTDTTGDSPAFHLSVTSGYPALEQWYDVTVEAEDTNNLQAQGYQGTLHLAVDTQTTPNGDRTPTTTYEIAGLVLNLGSGDKGFKTFSQFIRFTGSGNYRVTVTDPTGTASTGYGYFIVGNYNSTASSPLDADEASFVGQGTTNTSNAPGLILQNACLFPTASTGADAQTPQADPATLFANQESLNTYYTDVNNELANLGYPEILPPPTSTGASERVGTTNGAPGSAAALTPDIDPLDTGGDSKIYSCLAKCDQIKTDVKIRPAGSTSYKVSNGYADKLICQSQCLCGSYNSPAMMSGFIQEGSFRVRYCRVPSTQLGLPMTSTQWGDKRGSTAVDTLEATLDRISGLLSDLRNSGELLKETETTEMAETSLQKIKIGNIFNFNFVIGIKPLFQNDTLLNISNAQKDKQKELARDVKQEWNPGEEREKNKYVIVNDIAADKTANAPITNLDDQDAAKTAQAAIDADLMPENSNAIEAASASEKAIVGDEVANFIDSNDKFWQQMATMFSDLNSSAAILRQKINN